MPGKSLWNGLLNILYPPPRRCFFCNRKLPDNTEICYHCLREVSHVAGPLCYRCGRSWDGGGPCPYCADKDWAFSKARSVGLYTGSLRLAIHRFKFRNEPESARLLGRLLFQSVEESWWQEVAGIVPVPLHAERLRRRGYNQAELLARELAALSGRPLLNILERTRATAEQVGLNRQDRLGNVRDAFRILPFSKQPPTGQCLLLVDDVFTTGSTLDACARVLRRAGCREVWVATLAIANL